MLRSYNQMRSVQKLCNDSMRRVEIIGQVVEQNDCGEAKLESWFPMLMRERDITAGCYPAPTDLHGKDGKLGHKGHKT